MEKFISKSEKIDTETNYLSDFKKFLSNFSKYEKISLKDIKDKFAFNEAIVFELFVEDVFDENVNMDSLPLIIRKFINDRDVVKGIRFFYMKNKDGKEFVSIGFYGSSGTRDNDIVYENFLRDKFKCVRLQVKNWNELI